MSHRDLVSGKLKATRKKSLVDRIQDFIFSREFGRNYVLGKAKEKVIKTTGGLYPAPLRILDVLKTGLSEGFIAGLDAEAKVRFTAGREQSTFIQIKMLKVFGK